MKITASPFINIAKKNKQSTYHFFRPYDVQCVMCIFRPLFLKGLKNMYFINKKFYQNYQWHPKLCLMSNFEELSCFCVSFCCNYLCFILKVIKRVKLINIFDIILWNETNFAIITAFKPAWFTRWTN